MINNALSAVKNTLNPTYKTQARMMLARAIIENASVDELFTAASAEPDANQRLDLLREVLALDPYHQGAAALWESTAHEVDQTTGRVLPPPSASLVGAVNIFTRYGWDLKVEMPRIAQLQKRRALPMQYCVLAILIFSLPALLIVLALMSRARMAHVHLQLEPDGVLMLMYDRSSAKIYNSGDLAEIAASVADGLSMPWAVFCGVVSLIGWLVIF